MKFLHGSDNPNLTELTTEFSNHGAVYLTKRYSSAVLYGGCSIRFWDYDKVDDKLIIREVCEDSLEKMYKGKTFYIYTTENVEDVEEYEVSGCTNYKTLHNVKLVEKEVVSDAYEKIMELYNAGELKLSFWEDLTPEQQQNQKEKLKHGMCADMKLNYIKYRKDYDVLVKLYPEFALSEQEIAEIEMKK